MGYTHGKRYSDEDVKKLIMEVAVLFDPIRMPSRAELEDYYGDASLTDKISRTGGHYQWAEKLGLEVKSSETKLGIVAEREVIQLLRNRGHKAEPTSVKHPYDILVDDCVKVDVKVANISRVRDCEVWAYRIAKRQQTCDVYVFCENKDDTIAKMYVIPASVVSGQVQVEMGTGKTKYETYNGRFDIIEKASSMFKNLEI